jgi:TonB family protein
MKKLTAVIALGVVGTVCLLLGYYLGIKTNRPNPHTASIVKYSELGPQLPEPTERVEAKYPKSALADSYEGTVAVAVSIDEEGRVMSAKIHSSERKDVADAAVNAALKWRFKPVMANGKPTTAKAIIPFSFKLDSTKSMR